MEGAVAGAMEGAVALLALGTGVMTVAIGPACRSNPATRTPSTLATWMMTFWLEEISVARPRPRRTW